MRLTKEHIELIEKHYPREGCKEPWKKHHIALEIGCTDSSVEYQASKMGFGRWDYQAYIDRQRRYRENNRERIKKTNNERYRFLYRNSDEYRQKRLKSSHNYYHTIQKQKNHDKKANLRNPQ